MANVLINDQYLNEIANAIRVKRSSAGKTYKPREMAGAILGIETATTANMSFDDLINKTYKGEFISNIAEAIPAHYMDGQMYLTAATGLNIETIHEWAFSSCNSMTTINFPRAKVIHPYAFSYCSNLTTIYLPSAITVYNQAFMSCTNVTKIHLPVATSIGTTDYEFHQCYKLKHLILGHRGAVVELPGKNSFSSGMKGDSGWVYVPAELYNEYVNRYGSYLNFRKIEDYPDICGI